uniref:Uncharacterized protein n=1 Tax=Rhizophora mucronata TaxID=61149 RepID=A0A2P2MUZ8_RHIMU
MAIACPCLPSSIAPKLVEAKRRLDRVTLLGATPFNHISRNILIASS